MVEVGEEPLAAAIDENTVDQRREFVAGSSVRGPLCRQLFARRENFFDYGVKQRPISCPVMMARVVLRKGLLYLQLNPVFRERRLGCRAQTLAGGIEHLQAHQVLPGIEQAVAMIDTHPLY